MIATALLLFLSLAAQSAPPRAQGTPPRDAVAEKKGTASIKGKVVSAEGTRPLRRVSVSLSSPDLAEPRSVSTNSLGVYEFKELPAGRYTVSASRSGYLRQQYGQRRPGDLGRPLQLADGEALERIDFALQRMSVITGRVTDEIGEPLAGASVYPMQSQYFRGRRRMTPFSGHAQTDDTGQYRLVGLPPGDYYVMAFTRETWTMEGDATQRVGYAPTYYAGTGSVADAQRVRVAPGQERGGVDFSMAPGRMATISGTVLSTGGLNVAGESVGLAIEFSGPTFSSMYGMSGAKINPDGTFTIKNVGPGEYKLTVRLTGDKERRPESAATVLSVMGQDVDGISLVTGAGGSMSGRVVTDAGVPLPAGASRLRVSTRAVDPDSSNPRYDENNGRVAEDMSFEVTDMSGPQRISVGPLPAGWAVASVDFDGRDYADIPIEARHGQRLEGVTIVLSNRLPSVRGTLLDAAMKPAEGTAILFPADADKWSEGSRLVKTARPDPAGLIEFRLVPPGEYLAAAFEYAQEGSWNDPAFLEALREKATKVTVREGESPAGLALTLKKGS